MDDKEQQVLDQISLSNNGKLIKTNMPVDLRETADQMLEDGTIFEAKFDRWPAYSIRKPLF